MLDVLFDWPMIVGLMIAVNVIVLRYLSRYNKETRASYSEALVKVSIELETERAEHLKLRIEHEKLKGGV